MSIENNHVIYNIEINNLFLSQEIVCSLPINRIIDKVSLFPNGGNSFKLDLTISPGHSHDLLSKSFYQNMLDTIIGNIALTTNSYIGSPILTESNLTNKKLTTATIDGTVNVVSPQEMADPLHEAIEKNEALSDFKKLYVSALSIKDDAARFIFLYSILSILKGNQIKVDSFIKQADPAVEMKDNTLRGATQNIGQYETIFTFLRNALAHASKKISAEEINSEMSKNIYTLATITRKAVE